MQALAKVYQERRPCRGPEQLVKEANEDDKLVQKSLSSKGRQRLQRLLEEGLGDHILYLRLFQVPFFLPISYQSITMRFVTSFLTS